MSEWKSAESDSQNSLSRSSELSVSRVLRMRKRKNYSERKLGHRSINWFYLVRVDSFLRILLPSLRIRVHKDRRRKQTLEKFKSKLSVEGNGEEKFLSCSTLSRSARWSQLAMKLCLKRNVSAGLVSLPSDESTRLFNAFSCLRNISF